MTKQNRKDEYLAPAIAGFLCVTLVVFFASYAIKERCLYHPWDGYEFRASCYTDVVALYFARGLDEMPIPYLHGDGNYETPGDGDLEYWVGVGLFVGLAATLANDVTTYFVLSAIGLSLAGLVTVLLLALMIRDKRRALFFCLGSPLILYAFVNWDLLAVVLMVAGMYAFQRRSDVATGILLGLGGTTKLFPGFMLLPLGLMRWKETGRPPWRMVVSATCAFVIPNLPFAIINPTGWAFPWRFHSARDANYGTGWYMLYRHLRSTSPGFFDAHFTSIINMAALVIVAVVMILLVREEWRRDQFRPYVLGLGLLLLFITTSKAYSPQYTLWILPFFSILRLPWQSFVGLVLVDSFEWFALMAYFAVEGRTGIRGPYFNLLEVAVLLRLGFLIWLFVLSRNAKANVLTLPTLSIDRFTSKKRSFARSRKPHSQPRRRG